MNTSQHQASALSFAINADAIKLLRLNNVAKYLTAKRDDSENNADGEEQVYDEALQLIKNTMERIETNRDVKHHEDTTNIRVRLMTNFQQLAYKKTWKKLNVTEKKEKIREYIDTLYFTYPEQKTHLYKKLVEMYSGRKNNNHAVYFSCLGKLVGFVTVVYSKKRGAYIFKNNI